MIDIFGMQKDTTFFYELAQTKMMEEKFREVVFICQLFPEVFDEI